jgi:hypothetical protein
VRCPSSSPPSSATWRKACLDRLGALGFRRFNACLGESMAWAFPEAVESAAMAAWLAALPPQANSGDIYASLEPARLAG